MAMKKMTIVSNSDHVTFYREMTATIDRHAGNLSAAEILALMSNVIGKLIAMQDQRTMTAERAMMIVGDNIEEGNREMFVSSILETKGNA